MKSNASNSTTLEMKVPLMLAGDFEPHFSVKHMLKDVRIAAKLARDAGGKGADDQEEKFDVAFDGLYQNGPDQYRDKNQCEPDDHRSIRC